jgi:hypothetical protein
MSKDASSHHRQPSDNPSLTELGDRDLEQVKGGTFVGPKLPAKLAELAEPASSSVWVREVVEDVEAY